MLSKLRKAFKKAWYSPGFPTRPMPFLATVATGAAAIITCTTILPLGIAFGAASAGLFVYSMASDPRGNRKEIKAAEEKIRTAEAAAEAKKTKQLALF